MLLHETFRTGLVFPSQSKWVQTVVCYDQNLQKHKYLSTISIFLHKPSEQGSFFWDSRNESKQWYAMIKTYKNINISAQYQYFCTKPSEQGSFFQASRNESKQWYAMIKTYKNINISAQYQCFCMKPSEQGSFYQDSGNESKQWYAMIKTYKNINISAQYQYFCMKPSEQAHFSEPVEMSPNSGMLWSKLTKT